MHDHLLSLFIDNVLLSVCDVVEDLVVDVLIHLDAGPVLGSLSGQEREQRAHLRRLQAQTHYTHVSRAFEGGAFECEKSTSYTFVHTCTLNYMYIEFMYIVYERSQRRSGAPLPP